MTLRAGDAQTWFPPSMGEQVIVLSPEGDFANAAILPVRQIQVPSIKSAYRNRDSSNDGGDLCNKAAYRRHRQMIINIPIRHTLTVC
ncbi:MAG: phage baseplate assembly protein V [Collimonas sp.]|uniref:phage baseplate assembly protein V n=1 Tax=Collimonas sp. TaxID=1963772 RepID=UPI0032635427